MLRAEAVSVRERLLACWGCGAILEPGDLDDGGRCPSCGSREVEDQEPDFGVSEEEEEE